MMISDDVRIRVKGHKVQCKTFRTKTSAQKWARNMESAIDEGRVTATSLDAKHIKFNEVLERYMAEILPQKRASTQRMQQHQFAFWREQFQDLSLADITPARISKSLSALARRHNRIGTPLDGATLNRYMQCLSPILSACVKDWHLLESNPCSKIRRRKESPGRVRFLSEFERERLLKACQESTYPPLYTIVVLALSTAMRYSEIMNLRWPDVDLKRGRIMLHETKNGEPRGVAVKGKALALLKEHAKVRRLNTDLLFPSNKKADQPIALQFPWKQAVEKAGLEDFRFHDLRHSCASYLAQMGASPLLIAEVTGHKDLRMVRRYSHLTENDAAKALENMTAHIL